MNYCGECGNRMQTGDRFCTACGAQAVLEHQKQAAAVQEKPKAVFVEQDRKKTAGAVKSPSAAAVFFYKHKWWIIAAASFIIVLTGLYLFGKQVTSEKRYIGQFEAALRDGDAARVAFMLKPDNGKVRIDETNAKALMEYIRSAGLQDSLIRSLQDQAGGGAADSFLIVEKNGKQIGIYDDYQIVVRTSTIQAHTNYKGAQIKLNGKPVATADNDDFTAAVGPLLPGTYKLEAEFAGEYTTLKKEQQFTVRGNAAGDPVDLSMSGEQVQVDSNYTGAAIFIDGRDTGALTGGKDKLGPVALDGSNSVHVEKQFPWGTVKSESVAIKTPDIHVEINPNNDAFKNTVIESVSGFLKSWMEAFNKLDPSLIRNLSEDKKAGLISSIDGYKTNGMVYDGKLKKLVFDLDSIYLQSDGNGNYTTAVSMQNTYTQAYYSNTEIPPAPSEYTDTFTYKLSFAGGKWTVTDWYQDYNFKNGHVKEINM